MIFLIPFLIVVVLIFGVDYLYFSDINEELKQTKIEQNSSLEQERLKHIKGLFESE